MEADENEIVDTTHDEYDEYKYEWQLVRDCVAGTRRIKAELPEVTGMDRSLVYLPRLEEQTPAQYRDYQQRAIWVGWTARTLTTWGGLLFRKPIKVEAPGEIMDMIENDVDLQGRSLQQYVEGVVGPDVLSVGRGGTLIGWEENEKRPYFAYYPAESIINWRESRVRGKVELTLLVLKEVSEVDTDENIYTHETNERWRVIELREGIVVVSIFERIDKKIEYMGTFAPDRRGRALVRIPFVFHSTKDTCSAVGRIPLEPIARVNISHFQSSADLENGLHICGVPTPCIAGFLDENSKVKIGPRQAFVSDDTTATAFYLEFQGGGLTEIREAMKAKEAQMSALGARSITPEVGGAEAVQTVEMRATAEAAALVDIAQALEVQMTQALRWFHWWQDTDDEPAPLNDEGSVYVTFPTDFVSSKLAPEAFAVLTNALIAGKISRETYFHNLEEGEMFPDDWTFDEERASIQREIELTMPTPELITQPDPGRRNVKLPAAKKAATKKTAAKKV